MKWSAKPEQQEDGRLRVIVYCVYCMCYVCGGKEYEQQHLATKNIQNSWSIFFVYEVEAFCSSVPCSLLYFIIGDAVAHHLGSKRIKNKIQLSNVRCSFASNGQGPIRSTHLLSSIDDTSVVLAFVAGK